MLLLLLKGVLVAVGLLLLLVLCWIWLNRATPLIDGLPTIPGYVPLFGHFFLVVKNSHRLWDFVRESSLQFPPLTSWGLYRFGTPLIIYIQGEINVKYVMKDNFDNYKLSSNRNTVLGELFGNGIFGANGESWRVQRKAASHIFSFRQLNDHMTHIIIDHANILIQILTTAMESNQAIDMQQMFFRLTMDSFTEWAFGEKLNSLTQENVPFANAFDRVQQLMTQRIFDPIWKLKR